MILVIESHVYAPLQAATHAASNRNQLELTHTIRIVKEHADMETILRARNTLGIRSEIEYRDEFAEVPPNIPRSLKGCQSGISKKFNLLGQALNG